MFAYSSLPLLLSVQILVCVVLVRQA